MVVNSGAAVYTVLELTKNINFMENQADVRFQVVEAGIVTQKIQMYAVVACMITSILVGYIYEWFGRKYPITIFALCLGGLLCSLPHLGGDATRITLVRILVSIVCKATL